MTSVEILHTEGHFWQRLSEHLHTMGEEVTATQVPSQLPMIVDNPRDFLPASAGAADVTIAVSIHHDLLAELPSLIAERGGRALIGPREDPNWIRPGLINQIAQDCMKLGIECAFPEPFCSLKPNTPTIEQFCRDYQVGRPQLDLVVTSGRISAARCLRSAPCGLTAWVAEQLVGIEAGEVLIEKAKTLHHSRPCLASMTMLPGMDDTLRHKSLYLFEDPVREALRAALTAVGHGEGGRP